MPSSEYPTAVLEYTQHQGWNANLTEVREGVYIIGGARKVNDGTQKMLVMVICEPEKRVNLQHINYLYNTAQEKEVNSISLTYTVDIKEEAKEKCKKYGVNKITTETVRSQNENSSFGTEPAEISMPDSISSSQTNSNDKTDERNESGVSKTNQNKTESKDSIISDEKQPNTHEPLEINTILLIGLALPIIYFTLSFIDGFILGIGLIDEPTVIRTIANGINLVALAAAPISFHYDKKAIEKNSGWAPSSLFYLMAIPILNIIVSIYYLKKRKDEIGLSIENSTQASQTTQDIDIKNKDETVSTEENSDNNSTFTYAVVGFSLILIFSFGLFQWYYIIVNATFDSIFLFFIANSLFGRSISGISKEFITRSRWEVLRTVAGLIFSYCAFLFMWFYLAENNVVSSVFFFLASMIGFRYFHEKSDLSFSATVALFILFWLIGSFFIGTGAG